MACDPNELLDSARCLQSCLTYKQLDAIELFLLCQIADNPSGDSFYVLFETGDRWLTEDGLNLIRKE